MIVYYTFKEGSHWLGPIKVLASLRGFKRFLAGKRLKKSKTVKFYPTQEKAGNPIQAHSIRLPDGTEWDTINGFRNTTFFRLDQ